MVLKDFTGYMDNMKAIADAQEVLSKSDNVSKRNDASKYLTEQGLAFLGPELTAGLTPEQRKQYASQGLPIRNVQLLEDVGSTLAGKNLESLLKQIGKSSLEELALVGAEQFEKAGVKGYDKVVEMGQKFYGSRELDKRYAGGKGKLDSKEMQVIYEGVADEVVDGVKAKLKGRYSEDTLDATLNFTRSIIAAGGVNDKKLLDKGVKRLVSNAEKELRDYESKNKNETLVGYVVASLTALRNSSNPEEQAVARELIYVAAKKDEEAKKEAEKETAKKKKR